MFEQHRISNSPRGVDSDSASCMLFRPGGLSNEGDATCRPCRLHNMYTKILAHAEDTSGSVGVVDCLQDYLLRTAGGEPRLLFACVRHHLRQDKTISA
jgi:hypothetical protein